MVFRHNKLYSVHPVSHNILTKTDVLVREKWNLDKEKSGNFTFSALWERGGGGGGRVVILVTI